MNALGSGSNREGFAARLMDRLPVARYAQEQLQKIEQRVLNELKNRLDQLSPTTMSVVAFSVSSHKTDQPVSTVPAELLRNLLDESTRQSREQAGTAFFISVLRSLLPDEARILAAFSDGTAYPALRVVTGPRFGLATHVALENVSNVGKSAGVQWPDLTPVYLGRLSQWGLLTAGPEDESLQIKYEILQTDDMVRKEVDRAHQVGQRALLVRYTLRLSELGHALWSACQVEALS